MTTPSPDAPDARIQSLHEALHREHPEEYGYDAWCVGDCHEDGTHDPEDCPPKGECSRCVTCPLCPDWSTIYPDEWDADAQPAQREVQRA